MSELFNITQMTPISFSNLKINSAFLFHMEDDFFHDKIVLQDHIEELCI